MERENALSISRVDTQSVIIDQILAAERCEAATGPAVKPNVATDANAPDEAIDPLDAFMAEINEMEKAQNPPMQESSNKPKGRFHDEDEYDPAAEYMQVGTPPPVGS